MTDILIRPATVSDAVELQSYAQRLFAEKLPGIFTRPVPTLDQERDFIRSRIDPPNSTMLVAVLDDKIVGMLEFLGGSLAEETHAGTFGLSVDRTCRGQGIGTALVEALLAWAPDHGVSRVQAWSWASNPQATALYERLGFAREGICRQAVRRDGQSIDVVLLACLLSEPVSGAAGTTRLP